MIEKKPFVNYRIGEPDYLSEGKIITVRFNAEEYKALMEMAKILHISRDSTVLKKLALIGQNVVLNTFGVELLRWLTDKDRLIDDTKLAKLTKEKTENVTQNLTN